ncbi:MAG: transposase, partial [Pseudobdellovibrionaceae bacterium]|nr:transposase [Pseudobdellovibrionaceae bacterium]
MHLTLKLKIMPDWEAQKRLWEVSHRCSELWNACLEQRKDTKAWGKVNVFSQKKELPELKKLCPEFKVPSSQVLQNVVFDLDASYKMFFTKRNQGDKKAGQPGFKSRRYFYTQEYSQPKTSFTLEEGILRLSYGRIPKDWISLPMPEHSWAVMGTAKVVKIGFDRLSQGWFLCLSHEIEEERPRQSGHIVLFDPGCKTALAGIKTDGSFWEYDLSPLRKINMDTYKLIDELKSKLDLMKSKTSMAVRRLRKRIKKLFRKIGTRSKTYLHTLANQILLDHVDVKEFKIGNWDKRETLADTGSAFVNRRINRAVQNNNPQQKLIDILHYKAQRLGQRLQKVDERGTTRTCSQCDHKLKDGLKPEIRKFSCPECGFEFPRDQQ